MTEKKITFLGAGSTVFMKSIMGDCLLTECFEGFTYVLYDIDENRLDESYNILEAIKKQYRCDANIIKSTNRREALKNAKFVVNAIQVGGYNPSTIIDFEIPKKYGLDQTIGDTNGVGGIFRALRTLKVFEEFKVDLEECAPDCLFINYSNPMSVLTGYMNRYTKINAIGLCHSVQVIIEELLESVGLEKKYDSTRLVGKIAGINHMAWLITLIDESGNDIYPEVRKKAIDILKNKNNYVSSHPDLVRLELMSRFGYYVSESSEHSAEYYPYFIKKCAPELINEYQIPIDEYPRRCIEQIDDWNKIKLDLLQVDNLEHVKTIEYGARIMEAVETNAPYLFWGNTLNEGSIKNLPNNATVEIKCIADAEGITKTIFGELPSHLASLNEKHLAIHELILEAHVQKSIDSIYRAVYLDPHASAELSLEEMENLVNEMIEAHGDYLPIYR